MRKNQVIFFYTLLLVPTKCKLLFDKILYLFYIFGQKPFIFFLILLFLNSCCSNLYYVNDPVIFGNVTKKADFNLAGGLNVSSITGGSHFHGSVAISNNLFFSGSFSNYSGNCSETTTINGTTTYSKKKYSGNSFLCGIGYYKTIGKNFYFEGLLGGKYGNNANIQANQNFEYRHIKYFLQPGLTYTRDYFQAGFAFRFGIIDYLPYKTGIQNEIPEIATQKVKPYLDPALYFCGGGKYVKMGTQISLTFANNSAITYYPLGAAFGLVQSDPLSLSFFIKVTIPSIKTNK